MLPRRRTRRSPLTALLVALAAALVLFAAIFRSPLSSLLWRALGPILALRDGLGNTDAASLRSDLASTTAALADRDRLAAENAQLRAQLGRVDAPRGQIAAGVLMRPPGTPYDTLIVDAGAAQGVAVGDRVSAGALAIGTVDEVYASSARVVLYSAPGQTYDAVLEAQGAGRSGAVPVTVEGQGGGSLVARVPSGTDVRAGDTVAFPGLAGGMAGVVSGIAGADTDTFKTVYLRLPVNLFDLEIVYIQK